MDIKGQAIRHKTFGSGVITASASDTITVKFSVGEKKFVYPEVFKEYLVFQNQKLQQSITALIAEKQALAERQSQMEQMERERQRKLRSFTVTPNSHAVFDVPPEQAAQVCASFTVSTGRYLSGYSKGKPRLAERLKPNSACLLTERPSGESEQREKLSARSWSERIISERTRYRNDRGTSGIQDDCPRRGYAAVLGIFQPGRGSPLGQHTFPVLFRCDNEPDTG
jgi:hypothetical protein